jgi:hypothetical protein
MSKHQSKSGSRRNRGKERKVVAHRSSKSGASVTDYDDGTRIIKMNEATANAMKMQLERFREKFGREPGPNDPVFFDPDANEPRPLSMEKIEKGHAAIIGHGLREGILPPEMAFAMWATERILTTETAMLVSPEERAEWKDAVKEYLDGKTERSRVFRVTMVEAAKIAPGTSPPEAIGKLLAIAEELGVRDAVIHRFDQAVMD